MTCHYSPHLLPVYFAYLITNCSGFFAAVFALICVFSNKATDRALRHTLISFSVGNLLGPYMLAYDSKSLLCDRDDKNLDFVVIVTTTLSLSHFVLLLIYFCGTLKSMKQQQQNASRGVTSFIIISWTLSLVIGGMYVVSDRSEARLFCGIIIAVTSTIIVLSYIVTLYKHIWKQHARYIYTGALLGADNETDRVRKSYDRDVYFKVILLGVVILGYVGSTTPWLIEEIQEGLRKDSKGKEDPHTLSMVAYSLNFYFPIFFCIYLRYRMWKVERSEENTSEL